MKILDSSVILQKMDTVRKIIYKWIIDCMQITNNTPEFLICFSVYLYRTPRLTRAAIEAKDDTCQLLYQDAMTAVNHLAKSESPWTPNNCRPNNSRCTPKQGLKLPWPKSSAWNQQIFLIRIPENEPPHLQWIVIPFNCSKRTQNVLADTKEADETSGNSVSSPPAVRYLSHAQRRRKRTAQSFAGFTKNPDTEHGSLNSRT